MCDGLTYMGKHQQQQKHQTNTHKKTNNKHKQITPLLNSKALETHLWHGWTLKSIRIQKQIAKATESMAIVLKGLLQCDFPSSWLFLEKKRKEKSTQIEVYAEFFFLCSFSSLSFTFTFHVWPFKFVEQNKK